MKQFPRLLLCVFLLSGCYFNRLIPKPEAPTTSLPGTEAPSSPITTAPPIDSTPTAAVPAFPTTIPETLSESLPSPAPEGESDPVRTFYDIQATLDYQNHFVQAEEIVSFTNSTGRELGELLFAVEANRWPNAFALHTAALLDSGIELDYQLQGNQMKVFLPQDLLCGETIQISLAYNLNLPVIPPPSDTARPQPFGYTQRQTNLVDWYPYLPPYDPDRGWLLHQPGFMGEHQVYEAADFQVEIEITEYPLPLTLAASAPASVDGNRYHYTLTGGRNFVLSASHTYQVLSAQAGDITVFSYFFPYNTEGGEQALAETVQAIELYRDLFGDYPYASLSIVEADFLDGMEYSGVYFLSRGFYDLYDGSPVNYLTAISVHETAHQWWYGKVANDQALEPWLDEALCTYMEWVYFEHTYPEMVDAWRNFRIDFYDPQGWIDGAIYDYNGFVPYRNAVYLRGARFLNELRSRLGNEIFFSFLNAYQTEKAGGLATTADFFRILADQISNEPVDIEDLVRAYFQNPGNY